MNNNKVNNKADFSPDIRIDLKFKSWVENKEENSFDQNEIFEKIDYTKDF